MKLLLLNDDPVRRHEWQDRAACHDYGSDLFFEPDNELRVVRARREQAAKQVCSACPVRRDCLRFAESGPEVFGVWGGTTQRERAVRRRRRRHATARAAAARESAPFDAESQSPQRVPAQGVSVAVGAAPRFNQRSPGTNAA